MKVFQNINPDVAGKNVNVISREWLTDSTFKLVVQREGLKFFAGQHFALGSSDGFLNREYSIYSGATENNLEFLIKRIDGGSVSPLLADDSVTEVKLHGPYSNFVIEEPEIGKYLFLATGTGVAPFSSFVRSYPTMEYTLLLGTRKREEQYEILQYGKNVISCISREEGATQYKYVTDALREMNLSNYTHVYLCGNSNMIIDAQDILDKKGYAGQVRTEVFF